MKIFDNNKKGIRAGNRLLKHIINDSLMFSIISKELDIIKKTNKKKRIIVNIFFINIIYSQI